MSNRTPDLNRDNIWVRDSRDFAVRVEERDLRLVRDSGLRVEEGTRALLMEDGKLVETLRAGFIDMKSHKGGILWRMFKNPERLLVILTDDADAVVNCEYERLVTRDNKEVAIAVQLVFAIDHPAIFYKNFMRSARRVYHDDFQRNYFRLIEDALMEFVNHHSMDDLGQSRDLKADISVSLDNHMNSRLKADGVKLKDVLSVRWTSKNIERLRRDREHRSEIDDMLQEISHAGDDEMVREKLHDADIEALRGKLRRAREQAQVLDDDEFEKLKQEFSNNLRRLKTEVEAEAEAIPWRKKRLEQLQEWRRFVDQHELTEEEEGFDVEQARRKLLVANEKDKLFTREEMEELLAELEIRKLDRGDTVRARTIVSKKLELKEQMEMKLLDIESKFTVETEAKTRAFQLVKQQFDEKWDLEKTSLERDIEKEQLKIEKSDIARRKELIKKEEEAANQRLIDMKHHQAELEKKLAAAKTEIEIKHAELELNQAKALLGHELLKLGDQQDDWVEERRLLRLREEKAINRDDIIEREKHQVEMERQRSALKLKEDEQRFLRELKKLETENQHELDRNAQLGDMPVEKILALTTENAGASIERLMQTADFKNMTPEQIKAVQIRDLSPHQAEILKAELGNSQSEKLLETEREHAADIRKMLEQIQRDDRDRYDRERDMITREKRDFQDAMFRSRDTSERNIADIVKASNPGGGNQGPTILMPNQGGGAVIQPGGYQPQEKTKSDTEAEDDIRCMKCGRKVRSEANFCPKCGNKLISG